MIESKPIRCHKCDTPIGYVEVKIKSFLAAKSALDNVKLGCHMHRLLQHK